MDINLMVVGVGNSRLAVGVFVAGELRHVRRLPVEITPDLPAQLAEIWKEIAGRENAEVAAASVVPALVEPLSTILRDVTGTTPQWVGTDIDLPMTVATKVPAKTGIDRVLVTAAAYEQLGKACVVVDAGTAVTVNLCNDSGALVGGAIAPGARTMLESLHQKTAKLPLISLTAPEGNFGDDTESAMLHGVVLSIRGLVQSLAERWAEEQGTWPEVIATGGDAHALFDGWEIVHAISPDLLLYGIGLAYANHHIRHGT